MAKRGSPGQRKRKANAAADSPAARPVFVSSLQVNILLLIVVTFAAYFNAVHDEVIWDDRVFLADTGLQSITIRDFPGFFTESLWEASGNTTRLYRPFLLLTLGVQSQFFGDWWTGYHLVTVLIHVVATLLVYGFIREFLYSASAVEDKNSPVVLIAAMLFGVHPVLGDAVNSVFNGSEIYASIGVLASLLYLLRTRERPWPGRWLVVSAIFLVSLMYRESAVALPVLAVFTLWTTSKEPWPNRFRECLPVLVLVIPLAVYFGLRDVSMDSAGSGYAGGRPAAVSAEKVMSEPGPGARRSGDRATDRASSPLSALGLQVNPETVSGVFPMWLEALGLVVWPHPLAIVRNASTVPVWIAVVAQLSILSVALALAIRGHPVFLLGILFFYLAILPSSRIIAESSQAPVLLERMLYLPLTGIALAVGGGLALLAKTWSMRASITIGLLVIFFMIPATWSRNSDWSEEMRLLERDYDKTGNTHIFVSILKARMARGERGAAVEDCESHGAGDATVQPVIWTCGKVYLQAGRLGDAEPLLLQAVRKSPRSAWKRLDLAILYARSGRREEARVEFDKARDLEELPFLKEIMSALELMELYPHDQQKLREAKRHLEEALVIQPRATQARELLAQLEKRL